MWVCRNCHMSLYFLYGTNDGFNMVYLQSTSINHQRLGFSGFPEITNMSEKGPGPTIKHWDFKILLNMVDPQVTKWLPWISIPKNSFTD